MLAHCLTLNGQTQQLQNLIQLAILQAIPEMNAILICMQLGQKNGGLLRLGCYTGTFAATISENCCGNGALQQWRPDDR